MPPRKSHDTAPAPAVTKSRAKRPIKCEEAELTPTQKKRKERQDVLDAVKKRQARYMEKPTELEDNGFLARTTLFTQKLPAYPSFDEMSNKRKRVDHGPKTKKLARRDPWDEDSKFEKPIFPPDPPVGTAPRDQDPITAPGKFFSNLPVEICDEILRYILRWPHDIIVFDGWSRVFPRSRPRLNLSILYTCQFLRKQGLQILFGENIFTYDLRDPPASHGHTNPVLNQVFGNSMVPINEHGHLIRHIKIKVHRSRIHFHGHRLKFENAILKFLPGGGLAHATDLHTLTLEVPAETNSDLQLSLGTGKPEYVPICGYLREGSKLIDALLKIQIQWLHVLAWDKFGKCWQTKIDLRYLSKDEQMRLEYIALNKEQKHSEAGGADNQSITGHPATPACYRTRDVEAMEKLWDEQVKRARAGVLNLANRIETLVVDLDSGKENKLWEPVTDPASVPENKASKEFVCLPNNFREPPLKRSSRGRTTPICSKPDAKSMPTRSKANSKATAGTITGASLNHLNLINAKDTAKEARLLEAQQDRRMNKAELAMLTEQWLENLPQGEDIQGTTGGDELDMNIPDVEEHE